MASLVCQQKGHAVGAVSTDEDRFRLSPVPPPVGAARPAPRRQRPEDAEQLGPLLGELGYPATPEAVRPRLDRLLASASDRVLVAEVEERLAGFLCLHTPSAIHDDDPLGWITALVVAEAARGAGIGRALVEHAAALAREVGSRRLIVTTHLRRSGAHAFYDRLGFDFTGRRYVLAIG